MSRWWFLLRALTIGIRLGVPTTLEEHDHFTRRQKKFGVMEPNMKLMLEDFMKQMREDLHAGFTAQDASIAAHFAEFSLSGQQREERVATLETAAVCFDKALND
jgi:hypothetical protein